VGVIPKPFDPMEVSNEIRRIWDGRTESDASGA
jgi:hypothetical protein